MSTQQQPGEWLAYLGSVAAEVEARVNRVRHLIGGKHWLSVGAYHESLVRDLLREHIPGRFAVSTGFVRWHDTIISQQLDVIIWDRSRIAPLLEDGEFVIVPPDAVVAVFEVKTTLTRKEFRKALDLLHPEPWRAYSNLLDRLGAVGRSPVRGIIAFRAGQGCDGSRPWFEELARFYRERLDANRRAMAVRLPVETASSTDEHFGNWSELMVPRFLNLLDTVTVADSVFIDQVRVIPLGERDQRDPGYRAFVGKHSGVHLALARFMLLVRDLLNRKTEAPGYSGWAFRRDAPPTLASPALALFGGSIDPTKFKLARDQVWRPDPPFW